VEVSVINIAYLTDKQLRPLDFCKATIACGLSFGEFTVDRFDKKTIRLFLATKTKNNKGRKNKQKEKNP